MRHFAPLFLGLIASVGLASAQTPACTGLCLQQVSCSAGTTTSVSGTVYAPNGTDPLPNVLVFVPNAAVAPFTPGIECTAPGTPPSGSPLVGTTTGANGTFKLTNVPVGTNIPLVIQAGRWRRQLTIPTTTACTDTQFSTRMPRNQSEGDIPQIAVATGASDSVECVLRKVGVDQSEFTNPFSTGRIHLYAGTRAAGATIDSSTPSQSTLMNDPVQLAKYDLLMLPCQGSASNQTSTDSLANVLDYANKGGHIYASHYSYAWFYQNGAFSTVASWPNSQSAASGNGTGTIDTSFSAGKTLSDWLQAIGATTTAGQVGLTQIVRGVTSVTPPTQAWITLNDGTSPNPIMQLTWNTPVNSANQCGRVLFNEYHVETSSSGAGKLFPSECSGGAMTSQEKLLEYSLFDLTNSGSAPTLAPASLDFGSVPVGFRSAVKTFQWTNHSIFPVTVSSTTATSDFVVTGSTCTTVAAGASCQISVLFAPTKLGPSNGTLSVVSNASSATADLTGNGISPIMVSTSTLGFPNTDVGATSTQSLTVTNIAPGNVAITLTVTGDYAATPSACPAMLAAGDSCNVTVAFTPTATGSRAGTLLVNGTAVALIGTGVDFSIAVNPGSGSVIAGNSLSTAVSILPISGFSSVVTVTCTTDAPASTCTPQKLSLVPSEGAGETIQITTTSHYTVVGYQGIGRGLLLLLSGFTSAALLLTRRRTRYTGTLAGFLMLLCGSCLVTGCSGKLPAENSSYTPAGSYTYTVTATDGFLKHSATYTLKVTIN